MALRVCSLLYHAMMLAMLLCVTSTPVAAQRSVPLTPRDHTQILRAILENIKPLLDQIDVEKHRRQKTKPSSAEILNAALKTPGISKATKDRIRAVLAVSSFIERSKAEIPASTKAALLEIKAQLVRLREQEAPSAIRVLEQVRKTGKYNQHRGIKIGLDQAIAILRDGSSTIYSSSYLKSILGPLRSDKSPPTFRILHEDVDGAIGGGAGGCAAGAMGGTITLPGLGTVGGCAGGAVLGAVGGSVGNSAVAAVHALVDWLFD